MLIIVELDQLVVSVVPVAAQTVAAQLYTIGVAAVLAIAAVVPVAAGNPMEVVY